MKPSARFWIAFALVACVLGLLRGRSPDGPDRREDNPKTGFMANSPEENARQVMEQVMATPEGRATATRLADKDEELTGFQRTHGISERIAEAAIKEWVMTHSRDFDWNLEDVKAICLRNQRDGIPHEWLPEAEK